MKHVFRAILMLSICLSLIGTFFTQYHLTLITASVALITLSFLLSGDNSSKANIIMKAQNGIRIWQSPVPYLALSFLTVLFFAF